MILSPPSVDGKETEGVAQSITTTCRFTIIIIIIIHQLPIAKLPNCAKKKLFFLFLLPIDQRCIGALTP